MIDYAVERYGRDHVAQIVTFSQIKARAAVRDAARVLGYPYAVGGQGHAAAGDGSRYLAVDRVTKQIPFYKESKPCRVSL